MFNKAEFIIPKNELHSLLARLCGPGETPEEAHNKFLGLDPEIQYKTVLYLRYYEARRPFLNIYPSVLECLKNTSWQIDPALIPRSAVHDLGAIEARTPVNSKVPPFIMGMVRHLDGTDAVMVNHEFEGFLFSNYFHFGHKKEFREEVPYEGVAPVSERERAMMDTVGSVAMGVILLAADPRYCEPILLNRDQRKKLTPEQHAAAVDRAHRRGVVGFNLGAQIEISPHFRRPHFAIRWTGEGRKVPRLVPVKGAIINRALLGNIPTGYQDDIEADGDAAWNRN